MGLTKKALMQKQTKLGEIEISNEGYEMKIVKYNNYNDIVIEFQDKYKTKVSTRYQNFKKGQVKNPYHLSVFGVGYIGQGKYKISINGKTTKVYNYWRDMLRRCYDPYYINKEITYIDCYVCDEWLCFQNFGKWWEENVYDCNDEKIHLDKDILYKNNKIYSPKTCIFVPERINFLFIKKDANRGKYPIGVCWHKVIGKFYASCSIFDEENNRKQIHLGYYNTSEEAFLTYKQFKENYIKQVADEYKDLIPQRLYDAMYKYEVEIND